MIHLYAFVAGLRGLPSEELDALEVAGLTAVVGAAPQDDPVRHGLVVEELVDRADAVLPARFGERFADPAALEDAVAPRGEELRRRLDHVAGCVEVAVRVSGSSPDATAAADGRSYMQTRLRSVASVAGLHAALRERARAAVVSEVPAPPLVHDAAYLVDRDRVPALVAEVDTYVASNPGLNVVCTGPWAPASFAGAA